MLRGFDQTLNLILDECHERVYSGAGVEQMVLGLFIVRGDNMYVFTILYIIIILNSRHILAFK